MPEHPDTQPLAAASHTLSGHALAPVDPDEGPKAGMLLGPYQLLRPLGQGGMGEVWLAQQSAPLKREVAVKLLSRTLDDRIAEAWFLVERQALAMLVHPYIAQIYDAGQLPGGLMFFAMELVDGQTLDRWVCDRLPDLPRLIGVFEKVCQGIQHAHQRGLIHRDLKPANVLVSEHQGEALPKIIDFGVAIGGAQGRAAGTLGTAGTRAYMAPEQAQPDGRGIDARADVYGLGATLAALLCLRLGIRADGAIALSHLQAAQLTGSAAHIGPASDVPQEHTVRLRRMVPKPLRAILLKATASDREARYESAAALAEDLRRWRGGHPVVAMGGGQAYAIACFLRRHRWASAAAGIALLALLSGITVALYGLGQARQAQSLAEQRRVQAEGLVGVMLGDLADKLRPLGRLDLLEAVGDEAMRYLSAASTSSDAGIGAIQRARALRTLGEVYVQRQQTELAEKAFLEARANLSSARGSIDGDEPERLFELGQSEYWLGILDSGAGRVAAAIDHFRAYLDSATELSAVEVSDRARFERVYALTNLAVMALSQGDPRTASVQLREAIEIHESAPEDAQRDPTRLVELAKMHSWLATAQTSLSIPADAMATTRRQVELLTSALNERPSPSSRYQLAIARRLLGMRQAALGDVERAFESLRRSVLELEEVVAVDTTNQTWRRSLAATQSDLGWLLLLGSDQDGAMGSLAQATATLSTLESTSSDETRVKLHARLVVANVIQGSWDAARAEADLGKTVLESLSQSVSSSRSSVQNWIAAADSLSRRTALVNLDALEVATDPYEAQLLTVIGSLGSIPDSALESRCRRLGYDPALVINLAKAIRGALI